MTEDQRLRPSWLVIIPPPAWALVFVLAAWLAGWALGLSAPWRYPMAGWAVFVLGFFISASGRFAFAKAKTEVVPVSKKNSALVMTGPFRFTRNPMYLGILVATAGLALVIGTYLGFAAPVAFFVFVNFISIPYEEEKMERQFGGDYRAYKARVRRWI
ncbi:methyltransferase family protein [Hyphococcus luteus]|uniref:Isoprenylcysteine carboxylmethyltransferase family protein n=1 Tax=Hyphococcus luteus TaxID=2058213 RepID=A0A2S7K3I3_9PROT|nr:isoprenylcysteine carboxylmethyltransferase family protein [Marinicaulis flavus]PQA87046.1 isoprenylcysteine carboxylmethyltransferase family protein [Marinicaulis flavus]